MKNIEKFDALAAMIFTDLYQSFPVMTQVKPDNYMGRLVSKDDFDGAWEFEEYAVATLNWLSVSGYIYLEEDTTHVSERNLYRATLAPRAFDVLRQSSPLHENATLGESFRKVVAEKSWQGIGTVVKTALSTSISEAVRTAVGSG